MTNFRADMAEWLNPYDLGEGDEQRRLHIGRYNWAKEHIKGNVVANAACSCNYGYSILNDGARLVIGFDRNPVGLNLARSSGADLVIEKDIQTYSFQGFTTLVCLETFEHLKDPWGFLRNLSLSVKELVLSTPIIPTKHFNEWHLHDFTEKEILNGIKELGWKIERTAYQDEDQFLPNHTYILVYATR
jgi:hypothetical protein